MFWEDNVIVSCYFSLLRQFRLEVVQQEILVQLKMGGKKSFHGSVQEKSLLARASETKTEGNELFMHSVDQAPPQVLPSQTLPSFCLLSFLSLSQPGSQTAICSSRQRMNALLSKQCHGGRMSARENRSCSDR